MTAILALELDLTHDRDELALIANRLEARCQGYRDTLVDVRALAVAIARGTSSTVDITHATAIVAAIDSRLGEANPPDVDLHGDRERRVDRAVEADERRRRGNR